MDALDFLCEPRQVATSLKRKDQAAFLMVMDNRNAKVMTNKWTNGHEDLFAENLPGMPSER